MSNLSLAVGTNPSRMVRADLPAPHPTDRLPLVLRRAMHFMEANASEKFSLETLAVRSGCSRFHLARLFRTATGRSPMEYLMRLRVARGKRLLEQCEGTICEIAARLGFCDQSHFTRTFRKHMGMCPRDYAAAWIAWREQADGRLSRNRS